ncbi:hypothetical protein GFB49_15585 [Epibacterium sp. SM1979]|uniref:Nickel/cobalt efflux system n=1 Tax=Tritonibacter litoralis TaxID=2662264 RepID=A0A843YML9_9RHOB|nr:hypothetical protein [Tritonibacter litoralis]MQQ09887.1 hypothetical protein [Tritonibacter litoralis]
MRRNRWHRATGWLTVAAIVIGVAAVWLWGLGGADHIARWAAAQQQDVQNALAQALRALKSNQPGALMTLLSLCFAYGFFHAAGPGHGKLVIGGYGLGRAVPMLRLIGLALGSSLAQAGTAILLVVGGLTLLNWGRVELTGMTEEVLAPISYALIALVGLWLALRGLRKLWPQIPQARTPKAQRDASPCPHPGLGRSFRQSVETGAAHAAQPHVYILPHNDEGICPDCGHRHGPTLDEVANTKSLRDALAIVAAVAMRPCTGAVFLLLLTWRLDLMTAGLLGTLAMGLGTASITIAVAIASVTMRQGALAQLSAPRARQIAALMELCGGLVIALVASQIALKLI